MVSLNAKMVFIVIISVLFYVRNFKKLIILCLWKIPPPCGPATHILTLCKFKITGVTIFITPIIRIDHTRISQYQYFKTCTLFLQIQRLSATWHVLRQKFTDSAFNFEAKLRPTLKSMNECTNPQAPNTTIPHLLPFILLQERTLDDILGNFTFRVIKHFHKTVISEAKNKL
jgi:hypothetical protein